MMRAGRLSGLTKEDRRDICAAKEECDQAMREAKELSRTAMARKWGMSRDSLTMIVEGVRDHEDAELLRACDAERIRLLTYAEERRCKALAERYGVSKSTIEYVIAYRVLA